MPSQQKIVKDLRAARVPLARVTHQLNVGDRALRQRLGVRLFLSVFFVLTAGLAFAIFVPFEQAVTEFANLYGLEIKFTAPTEPKVAATPEAPKDIARNTPDAANLVDRSQQTSQKSGEQAVSEMRVALGAPADTQIAVSGSPAEKDNVKAQDEEASPNRNEMLSATQEKPSGPKQVTIIRPEAEEPTRELTITQATSAPTNVAMAGPSTLRGAPQNGLLETQANALQLLSPPALGTEGAKSEYLKLSIKNIAPETSCTDRLRNLAKSATVYFEKASTSVSFKDMQRLKELSMAARDCKDVNIDVGGHTDKSGENLSNLQLSWQRAEAVVKAIQSLGIKTAQFSPVGYGSTRPVATESGSQAQNRRVEFIIR